MRLIDLNPGWRELVRDFTPETGGVKTGYFQLSFRCPACNNGGIIVVNLTTRPAEESSRLWNMNVAPDGPDWPNRLTVTPSIGNEGNKHGRREPPCAFHGHITNGEVSFPGQP